MRWQPTCKAACGSSREGRVAIATPTNGLPFTTAMFDLDGTLIDSNDAHARAWHQALREHGIESEVPRVRRLIGMGGDKLLPAIAALEADSPKGQAIARRKKAIFEQRLPGLQPTLGARMLVEFLRERQIDLVIATSADEKELTALLAQAGVDDLFERRASKDDANESKPDPDIVQAALKKAGARPESSVLIGDTPYDLEAAARAGVSAIALRCGGYWRDADFAGAMAVFDDPLALLNQWRTGRATAQTGAG